MGNWWDICSYFLLFIILQSLVSEDVPITPELFLSYLSSPLAACRIKDCALSPHLNINGADRAGLPGVFTVSL